MSHVTYWKAVKPPRFATVTRSQHFDVAIVGAGITGLTAAYLLKRAGKRVCVIERDRIGSVDTGNTTAHLTQVTDLRLKELVKSFGKEGARLAWQGGATAINTIEHIARTLKIDCEFRRIPGFLHQSLNARRDESKQLSQEADLARELGFDATFLDAVPFIHEPGIRFSNQAKFHPLLYLAGLSRAVHGEGSVIFEQSECEKVEHDPMRLKIGKHHVECDYLMIATHVPLMGKTGLVNATIFQSKLAPYSSYVIGAKLPRGKYSEASYWDTSEPYYYLRIDHNEKFDYAIFGGEDHKTGQESNVAERYAKLEQLLLAMIPNAKVTHRWSGQVIETNDGLPYIGETAERQFVATGFAGNGTTFGTLAAMMARDAVLGKGNPWQNLFSVNRKKLRGGLWDYLTENLDYPYYMVRDRLARPEGDSPSDVMPGEGKILKIDGQQVACSRDKSGDATLVSAVCTHMGCLVHWNSPERTWDCPCHGSRFHPSGEVLAGPAESPLKPIESAAVKPKASAKQGARKQPTARRKTLLRQGSAGRAASPRSAAKRSRRK